MHNLFIIWWFDPVIDDALIADEVITESVDHVINNQYIINH